MFFFLFTLISVEEILNSNLNLSNDPYSFGVFYILLLLLLLLLLLFILYYYLFILSEVNVNSIKQRL